MSCQSTHTNKSVIIIIWWGLSPTQPSLTEMGIYGTKMNRGILEVFFKANISCYRNKRALFEPSRYRLLMKS